MTTTAALPTDKHAPQRRTLVQHAFVRGATAMPLGTIGGALLGWLGEASTDAARLEQTLLTALLIGFVVAPAMAAALASARYERPNGSRMAVLLRSTGIPALAGLGWSLFGAAVALLVAPLTDLELPLPNFLLIAGGIGVALGAVTGLLTMLVRLVRGGGTAPPRSGIDTGGTAPHHS